ncbi:MAG: hypothetical protein KGI59_02215, partial [Patescibacteria group bacterium]|nr:hypothetical protein [Patescibacteria group bacterium]
MLYSNTNSAQALEDLKRQIQKEEHDHELKSRELRSLEAEEQNAKNKLDQAQKEFEAKKAKAEA